MKDQKYIRVCGYLPDQYKDYALVYYRDITPIIDNWIHNIISLLIGGTIFSAVLSICLRILIEHLFGPLEKISLHESKRLKTISEMLLNLAILREEIQLNKKMIKCSELLKRVHQLENVNLREKDIQFNMYHTVDEICGNEELMESMLSNLIDNAIKACNKGESKITVRAYEKEGHPVIEVEDNGKGMTKEQVGHVTEVFYRVDKARSRNEGGNGLGLTLCQVIAKKHNAKLTMESEPAKGTKISIIF